MVGAERAKVSGKEVREVMGRLGEASGFCSDDTGNEGRVCTLPSKPSLPISSVVKCGVVRSLMHKV